MFNYTLLRKDLTNLLFLLFSLTLPLNQYYSTLFLFFLISINLDRILYIKRNDLILIILIAVPFFLSLIWLLNTSNYTGAIPFIERNISLLLLPLVILNFISYVIAYRAFITIIFSLIISIIILPIGIASDFYLLHRSYSGLYYVYAIVGSHFFFKNFYVSFTLKLMFLTGLLLTTAKMPIFIGIGTFILLTFINHQSQIHKKTLFASFFIMISVLLFGLIVNNDLRSRIEKLTSPKIDFIRYRNWNTSIEVISENLLFGVGTGDGLTELQKKRNPLWLEYTNQYNSHNQYLDYTIKHGLIGLSIFLLSIFAGIFLSIKFKYWPVFWVILITLQEFFVEVFFSQRAGIFGFAFFMGLYFILIKSHEKNN